MIEHSADVSPAWEMPHLGNKPSGNRHTKGQGVSHPYKSSRQASLSKKAMPADHIIIMQKAPVKRHARVKQSGRLPG